MVEGENQVVSDLYVHAVENTHADAHTHMNTQRTPYF